MHCNGQFWLRIVLQNRVNARVKHDKAQFDTARLVVILTIPPKVYFFRIYAIVAASYTFYLFTMPENYCFVDRSAIN